MAGIDVITKEILQDASDRAAEIAAKAQEQAAAIEAEARETAAKNSEAAAAKAERDVAAYDRRVQSQIRMEKREAVLAAKQEVIDQVIEEAYHRLMELDDQKYFDMLEKLIAKNVQNAKGEILFSASDRERLPADFMTRVQSAAERKGGSLTLSKETAGIDGGFVLRYGGIDENCSLKALFDEKREVLQDRVHSILW